MIYELKENTNGTENILNKINRIKMSNTITEIKNHFH